MHITLKQRVASNSHVDPHDILQLKKALNRAGCYTPPPNIGITSISDTGVFSAIKTFQRKHGLGVTGIIGPDDETLKVLNDEISETPEGKYIWRTVGDEDVREEHAVLDGTVRDWKDSPNPGDDYNCRCWVEEVGEQDVATDGIKPVYPELLLIPSLRVDRIIIRIITLALKKLFPKKVLHTNNIFTEHGLLRLKQRGFHEKEILEAIESAKKMNAIINKTGRYKTPQIIYHGKNGLTVVVETQGRNAGKVITVWRN